MKPNFISKESYLHSHAKNLLADVLRKLDKENDHCEFNVLHWRSNYGVFTELPFHVSDDVFYFECSDGIKYGELAENLSDRFDRNFDRGRILFVPDICIFHKGTPKFFIEVVHKNHVSESKLNRIKSFFSESYIEVYEVSAYQIMSQVGDLSNIDFNRIL